MESAALPTTWAISMPSQFLSPRRQAGYKPSPYFFPPHSSVRSKILPWPSNPGRRGSISRPLKKRFLVAANSVAAVFAEAP